MTKEVDYFEEQEHFVGPLGDKGEVTVSFEVVHIDQIERRISLGQTEKKLKIIELNASFGLNFPKNGKVTES